MKAIYIYPADIGASGEWASDWMTFIKKLGWEEGTTVWSYAIVVNIET